MPLTMQWAAVSTQFEAMREPPQFGPPKWKRETRNLNSRGRASGVPPTMRTVLTSSAVEIDEARHRSGKSPPPPPPPPPPPDGGGDGGGGGDEIPPRVP